MPATVTKFSRLADILAARMIAECGLMMNSKTGSFIDRDARDLSAGEWNSRVECAAGHHLLELYRLTDMVEGVLALRVEDEADAYLLKPYRTFFDEVRASELVKVRFDESPDAGGAGAEV